MSTVRTGTRRFLAVFLLVSLLVAGVASYYASSHPDGLEYVAGKVGFIDRADDSPAAKSPLADYSTRGVDNDRVSGGIAGVAGSALVLVLAGGLFWALRRRGPAPSRDSA
jgi:cobalt/nickel transport protein